MRLHKLSDRKVQTAKEGLHGDGGGLLLQVTKGAAGQLNRSWLFRFQLGAKERRMGLGSYPAVGLADAREKAAGARKLVAAGQDPIAERDAQRASQKATAKAMTFDQCRDAFFKAHQAGWSPRHANLWLRMLEMHVTFGKLPVAAVDTGVVMKTLGPLWATAPDVAARLRGRIERVLDWAKASGYRTGENPARWSDLKFLLPAHRRVHKVTNFAALPYAELPKFMGELRAYPGSPGRALEFLILTACRTNEVLGARWSEVDTAARVWTVPPERSKTRKAHRVPLSDAALRILERQAQVRENDFVFPGHRSARLTATVLPGVLARMGHDDITVHGFRSTFRTWAAECTTSPREVCEQALAHVTGNAVEQAYQRSDLFEKRRALMADWAEFIGCAAAGQCAAQPAPSDRGRESLVAA